MTCTRRLVTACVRDDQHDCNGLLVRVFVRLTFADGGVTNLPFTIFRGDLDAVPAVGDLVAVPAVRNFVDARRVIG